MATTTTALGRRPAQTALDVQELLCAQVGGEAGLRDGVVAQLQSDLGGDHGVAAVSDVGEGAAVDEGRGTLQGLDQVGLQSVLQQGGHGALGFQVMGGDRLAVIGVGHDHPAQPFFQVGDAGGQTQYRHDLAGHGDVKAVLPGHALHLAAQAVNDVAQLPVIHVHAALPDDLLDVDAQGIALLDMVVQHSGQQVVGSADGVEVTGKVQVDVLHGDHLSVAAAGSAALHAEYGAERGLPQSDSHGVFAQLPQTVGQTHGGGGLALAGRGGVDGGHQDQLAVAISVMGRIRHCWAISISVNMIRVLPFSNVKILLRRLEQTSYHSSRPRFCKGRRPMRSAWPILPSTRPSGDMMPSTAQMEPLGFTSTSMPGTPCSSTY